MRRGSASQRLQDAWLERGTLARLLWPLAALYGVLLALRRLLLRAGVLRAHALPVPVIVVGNLVAGGAGKTPTVMAVVSMLRRHGHRPGIVSRGYGRTAADVLPVEPDTP